MISWEKKNYDHLISKKNEINYYSRLFNIEPFIIEILFSKGIITEENINHFLYPSLKQLHNPFLLNDMKKAIIRIINALKNNEKIMIFGDYDVDGITATSILYKALCFFNGNIDFIIPSRKDGYGLSVEYVNFIKDKYESSLIITVDNGSSSHEAINRANELGIDTIVTDHHEVLRGHPNCLAFINPRRKDNQYPFPHLSGAGVSFKVVHALFEASSKSCEKHLWDYIEFASIGTIADMMTLTGENRIITSLGLQKLKAQPSIFFKHLSKKLYINEITSSDIGFKIAPILNSTGRIGNANDAVRILIKNNPSEQDIISLIELNKKRKFITESQFLESEFQIESQQLNKNPIIVVEGEFDDGIIGILASRIANKYYKPSVVISKNGKGSARSVSNSNFSIIDAIEQSSPLLKTYGGHKSAAGFSIDFQNLNQFKKNIIQFGKKHPVYQIKLEYNESINLTNFPNALLNDLQLLEPFGNGNSKPVFLNSNTFLNNINYFGHSKEYSKFYLNNFEVLCFTKTEQLKGFSNDYPVSFLYSLHSKNQFIVHDLHFKRNEKAFLENVI